MNKLLAAFALSLGLFSISTLSLAVTGNVKVDDKQKIIAIQSDLINLKDEIKENQSDLNKVRNDQVNYKIEKDLLKEVYSSIISTVNTVVSVVFALITLLIALLGYLGLRNIREI